jgi:hypothetical protein
VLGAAATSAGAATTGAVPARATGAGVALTAGGFSVVSRVQRDIGRLHPRSAMADDAVIAEEAHTRAHVLRLF